MKKYIICFVLLIIPFFSYSQDIQVLSEDEHDALSFSTIVFMLNDSIVGGIYTNSDGKISLNNMPFNTNFIEISCIGYKKIRLERKDIAEKIYLESEDIELEEVNLSIGKPKKRKDKIKKIGYPAKAKGLFFGTSGGYEIVTLIKNNFNERKRIKSFLFYVKNFGDLSPIFKIVFYTNENNFPEKPYKKKKKNTFFTLNSPQKGKIKLDVSHLKIDIPKNGMFIGIEYVGNLNIETNKINYTDKNDYDNGITISMLTLIDKNTLTYTRSKFYNKEWQNINYEKNINHPYLKNKQYIVPAFGIEVYE